MACLLPYSLSRLDSWNRVLSVFHDLATRPVAASMTTKATTILRPVSRGETVARAVPSNTSPMVITPVREIVKTTPRQASATPALASSLYPFGRRDAMAEASTGAVVQKKTERL